MPAIAVENLTRSFGEFVAVDHVSFAVEEGEIFGFLGSNGAGKSTTIRMLCGLLRPTAGGARVDGVDVVADPEAVKQRIGYVSQRFSLYEQLTVSQNVRFFAATYGLTGARLRHRQHEVLERNDLVGRERVLARDLPGGWRQRLALSCAILHEPRVLFLDEPTAGLDPLARRRFWQLIDQLAEQGVTVLITTHHLDEAEHCHRLGLIHEGRLVAVGPARALKDRLGNRAIMEIRAPRAMALLDVLDAMPEVARTSLFGTTVHAVLRPGQDGSTLARHLKTRGIDVTSLAPVAASLEDVFLDIVEGSTDG